MLVSPIRTPRPRDTRLRRIAELAQGFGFSTPKAPHSSRQ
jgi:hypothetical protein